MGAQTSICSRTATTCVFLLVLIGLAGCADDGPPMGQVTGEVTLDGKPVQEGVIHFASIDGSTKTVSTFIRAGKFEVSVPVGANRVEISAVSVPKIAPGQNPETLTGVETIPQKYNLASELTAEVVQGANELRFDLLRK